ncbi:MAG: T9SS C-terminal target domain-containing protein, partial [Calditrichaeota bacterium]
IQGQFETVNIYYDGSSKQIGGFDLLIAYDQTALTVGEVRPGSIFTNCGWEYFTYRFGADGNCNSGCPSGILRIIGIAETNNGGYHPTCFLTNSIGDLAQIDFLVTNDRTLECQYAPVEFFWMDCGDNTLSSVLGDTLWMSRDIYSFEYANITNNNYGFPGFYGAHEDCMIGGGEPGKMPIRCVDFTNGGVDIVCADSIDAVGDINLNEVAYEIADAVLYSNYFVYGLSVFTVNIEGQIAASDVNKDGIALSVADLVYLIRVIVGDAPQYPKPVAGYTPTAEFALQSGMLSVVETTEKIGAISFLIEGDVKPELTESSKHMDLRYNFDGENTRAIVFALNGQSYLSEGEVLKLNSVKEIKEISVGSYDGLMMTAKLENLPDRFELYQNYPNPFNPTTTIRFSLPVKGEYELVIYNVLGQTVESHKENSDAGYIEFEWDASKYASGVYFYRLRAGSFSDTKKMVLLK